MYKGFHVSTHINKVSFVRIISSASNRSSFSRILLKSSSCPTLEKILSTGTSVGGMLSNLKAISLNGENIGPNIFSDSFFQKAIASCSNS